MWPWIKRLRGWAMHELWPMHRIGLQPQALHYSYEKAGLTVHDQAIPWNAEAVVVEALVRLATTSAKRKADFQLRVGRQEPILPECIRRDDGEERHHIFFRFPPPGKSVTLELSYRDQLLGQLTLPMLSREDFIGRLQLHMPTLFVRLGDQSVACHTFVATQCRGILASVLITSPTSLVPMLDLGLQLQLRSERGTPSHAARAILSSSQLAGKQALISIVPKRLPKRIGQWTATWEVGDKPLAQQQLRGISQRAFQRSLRLSDTRFVVQRDDDQVCVTRHLPSLEGVRRIGPCFLVSSREPGMAGFCSLQVRAQVEGAIRPPMLVQEEILISDGPTMVAPGTVDVADAGQVSAFELRSRGGVLGSLPLSPAPVAGFNAEGAFKPPEAFLWSGAAEDELNERLARLLDGRATNP